MDSHLALMKFASCLENYKEKGISEWFEEDVVFTSNLATYLENLGSSVASNLATFFENVLGVSDVSVQTYVLKTTTKSTRPSQSDCLNGYDSLSEYIGSPLPLEDTLPNIPDMKFDLHSTELQQHSLISEQTVRKILSFLNLMCTGDNGEILGHLLPMVLFCKGYEPGEDPSCVLYVTPQLSADGKLTGLIQKRVTLSGPYSSDIWRREVTPNSSPTHDESLSTSSKVHSKCLENIIKRHRARSRPNEHRSVSMQSVARFELFRSSKSILDGIEEDVAMTLVTADVTCTKVTHILGIDKQNIKEVKVHVTPVPGDMRSSAYSLYKTIETLEGFFHAFDDSGEVLWSSCMDEKGSKEDETNKNIVDKVRKLITLYNNEWLLWKTDKNAILAPEESKDKNESVSTEETSQKMFTARDELDFTEKLWETLKYVGSSEDLVESFKIVLTEVIEGRATQFWLHRNNKTTLAKLIQESYKGPVSSIPKLTDETCIKLLIELGLDKLLRDYTNFFIKNRLASSNQLSSYTESLPSDSDDSASNLQSRFKLLKKLHHIVELVVQCTLFLRFLNERTFAVIRTALQDYIGEDLDFNKTFSFHVNYSEIESMVTNSLPFIWRLTLKSGEKYAQKATNVCWMMDYPFSGVIAPPSVDFSGSVSTPTTFSGSSLQCDVAMKYHIATQNTSIFTF